MLATNTSSEWSLIRSHNKSNGVIVNFGTSLLEREEHTGANIMLKVMNPETDNLERSMHSHPDNSRPSGCPEDRDNERGDIPTARVVQRRYPYFDNFELFRVKSLKIDRYNKDSHDYEFENYPPTYIY